MTKHLELFFVLLLGLCSCEDKLVSIYVRNSTPDTLFVTMRTSTQAQLFDGKRASFEWHELGLGERALVGASYDYSEKELFRIWVARKKNMMGMNIGEIIDNGLLEEAKVFTRVFTYKEICTSEFLVTILDDNLTKQ